MNLSFICTTQDTSVLVTLNNTTLVKNGNRLFPGLFAYSETTKSCTNIKSIINETTIELNQLPLKTGDFNLVFSDLPPYKYLDLCESLKDIQQIVNANGQFIGLNFRNEDDITRDNIKGINTRIRNNEIIYLKAHPVQFNPTTDQIEKAGFMDQQSVILWFARKDFMDIGKDFNDFDEIRDTIIIGDETYKINDKNKVYQMGNEYLYYTIGLRKV